MQTDVVHAVHLVGGPQPLVERAVVHLVVLPGTAGHEDDVRVRDIRERGLGDQVQRPTSSATEPGCSAAKTTSAPGRLVSTWYGPTASRAVNRS